MLQGSVISPASLGVALVMALALNGQGQAQIPADSAPPPPSAPSDTGSRIANIVVTPQLRAERLQDVPVAIAAFKFGKVRFARNPEFA